MRIISYRRVEFARAEPVPARPSLAAPANLRTKLRRLVKELKIWRRAGLPVSGRWVRQARAAACAACSYWSATGNLGLGECRAPGCGCTRGKRWLATAKCPLNKWPA